MQAIGGKIRNELPNCDESKMAGLMNALQELEQSRDLCSEALLQSRDMDDELANRVMAQIIAEADRMITLAKLALYASAPYF